MSEVAKTISRAQIDAFHLALARGPQTELKVVHHFGGGIYGRELHIPAGVPLVGKRHLTENMNTLSQGSILVADEFGMRRVDAPCTLVSPPGVKRVGLALTDCVWTTYHATNETDLVAIEAQFIEPERNLDMFTNEEAPVLAGGV